ncbi:MAG TPA: geranylgeranyl pyrophosphate synthase [Alphaproteobacteria bacterium]|jgi:geranylgeranyl pyrophosphate synthase|nr:geranylgeranyl pyrophosphate synthase [Alphaproteobacteria bacterium]|tara:strand:+ start:5055 stop:6080 length:1026 start_codon:yes stop_codon:yes gene_type:complete
MTNLSTPSNEILRDARNGAAISPSTSEIIHDFIIERMPQAGQPLAEAAAHHFASPGKMLRAKMALSAADLLKVDRPAALHWAAAIEVLHNASLIHDDICDGDRLRRGRPAVWSQFGRDVALTLGDWLVALSFELAAEAAQRAQTPMLVKILATHMKTTTLGEAREFDLQPVTDWQHYLQGAGDKTAPLLTAPIEGVATMALHGGAAPTIGACFRALGNAYQIGNDILNFSGRDGADTCGSDLGRRAPNGVVVLFRDYLDDSRRADFDDWYRSGSDDGFEDWLAALRTSRAPAEAARRMNMMLDDASRLSESLPAELSAVIRPIQQLLQQVCLKSVASLKQG